MASAERVTISASNCNMRPMLNSEEQRKAIEGIRASLGSMTPTTVLLIEDNPDDAILAKDVLRQRGIDVVWEKKVVDAGELFRSIDVKLIFLDLKLEGGRSGLEVLAAIKQIRPESWVIILSGAYAEDSKECKEALQLGAAAIMLKPLTPKKVELVFGSL